MSTVQVGDILDNRYRIDTPIARGGMSTVYRCVDLRLGRQVAAKVMDDRYLNDPVFRTRFEREARSMAQLNHPNLVNVYDFSSSAEHAFLIMELITGGTLRELLAERGPMPPHAATQVMRSLLTGLSVAHEKGMVHRDIKPDNVLINADHRVKLADFGLVRAIAESERTSDQIVGTVSYLSPEQVDGGPIGPASDVYSAGVVLFELLTGTLPFSGDTQLAHAMARLHTDVPAPSSRIDGVPPLFDELVAAATHRDPEQRFSSATEFLAALEDVAAAEQLPSFKVPVPRNAAASRATTVVPLPPLDDAERTAITARDTKPPKHTQVLPAAASPVSPATPRPETAEFRAPAPVTPAPPAPLPSRPVAEPPVPDPQPDYVAPVPVSNRSPIKVIAWLVVVGLLISSVAVGGWWFGSGRYGEIPQVLGLDEAQAVTAVAEAGFHSSVRQQYHNEVAKGAVIGTDPPFGQRAPRGSDIAVLVSSGKPTVPALPAGGDVKRFRQLLSDRGLHLAFGAESFSDDVPIGGVVSTIPPVGSYAEVGSTVTASLSKGPAPVTMPQVRGMSEEAARAAVDKAGLKVAAVDREFAADLAGGTALGSSPVAGTELKRGTEVRLRVSNALKVPDVQDMDAGHAKTELQSQGFVVTITHTNAAADRAHTVLSQSKSAGELVDPAHPTIELKVNSKVRVANVVGKNILSATKTLEDQGLRVKVVREGDVVIRQSPRGKQEVEAGEIVELSAF
ncbi:Stk1 family PASTA domain-containing Ser/Thr kinase [Staphylococcus chromogenes]|nr:Stk1 family PASTA domain-containing Ser/Thr kinase [Staphylococcus chromogenes]